MAHSHKMHTPNKQTNLTLNKNIILPTTDFQILQQRYINIFIIHQNNIYKQINELIYIRNLPR